MGAFKLVKLIDPIYVATNGVAVAHTGSTATSGTFKLYEGNNITFTTAGNSVTIHGGAGVGGGVGIAAGTRTATTANTLLFDNANGITFGLNAVGGSVMTASHNAITTARASNDAIGLNTALTANGVAWTVNSSGLSLNVPAFLTTAMASNRGTDFVQANAAFAGTNASGTIASNGISVSVNPAAAGVGVEAGTRTATTAGNLRFETGNGITFGLNAVGGSVMTASHNAITTGRASNDGVGLNTALTAGPLAWTVNSDGISLNAGSAAGTTSGFGGNLISGSMTHNTAGLNLSLNHPAWLTTAMLSNAATISAINVSAGTTSSNQSSIGFSNGNGISFGFSGASITGSHNAITTARASNDAVGLNTALTAGPLAWTVNSGGISLNAGSAAGTTSGFAGNLLGGSMTHNTAGLNLSLSHPAWLTTAAQSDHSHGNPTLALTNLTGTTASASNGFTLSLSAAAPGVGGGAAISGGANSQNTGTVNFANSNGITFGLSNNGTMTASFSAPAVSNSAGSFTFQTLNFSNANNVTFGTSAGSIVTASVAAPGAAAENNWMTLLGANVSSNSSASGSTIGLSGSNITLAGTNNSQIIISAPATSQLSATGGISLSTNGSTISIGLEKLKLYEPVPMLQSGSTTYAPGIGTWHIQPLIASLPIDSGRINLLHSFGSTSNLFAASNGTSFATGTTGGASYSFAYSKKVALFSLGAGTNSTRLESFWSSQWTLGASHSMGVSLTNATQLTGQRQLSMSYIASVGTDGGTTGAGIGATHNASFANSSTATSAYTSAMSSIYNMLSGANLMPIPFNTSISAGNYWIGEMWSTASTTAGTSINGGSIWPFVNQVGFYGMASMSHRQWGKTASSTGSQYFPGKGIFSVVSANPPSTIGFSDIRSLASHQFNYYNIIQSGASV